MPSMAGELGRSHALTSRFLLIFLCLCLLALRKVIMQVQPHSGSKGKTSGGSAKAASSSSSSSASASPSASASARGGKGAYSGVWSGLVKMWREEGMAGLMRGNGINCLRIAPYSAVQFSSYEVLKRLMQRHNVHLAERDASSSSSSSAGNGNGDGSGHGREPGELGVIQRLAAGALAGIASVVSTYPLDLVRSRISIASASLYAEAKTAQQSVLQSGSSGAPPSAPSGPGASLASAGAGAGAAKTSGGSSGSGGGANEKELQRRAAAKLREELKARQMRVPGIWETTVKVYREEGGIRGLYRGCIPTSAVSRAQRSLVESDADVRGSHSLFPGRCRAWRRTLR